MTWFKHGRLVLLSLITQLSCAVWAQTECRALRASGLKLLPHSTFEVTEPGLLKGCFSGYLPPEQSVDDGLYRFGVFRSGTLATPFPVVEAGMDLASNPLRYLQVNAVSFQDIDKDGHRDVMVIGENLGAKGTLTFVQIYWGCGDRFVYDSRTNSEVIELLLKRQAVNVGVVQAFMTSRGLKARCSPPNQ